MAGPPALQTLTPVGPAPHVTESRDDSNALNAIQSGRTPPAGRGWKY